MGREDIEFQADDVTLRGWFYRPAGPGPFPTIIVSHGFGSLKEQYLDRFAEVFAKNGLASLVYDHRNFGASGGTIRNEIDPFAQMHDTRHAITFATTHPQVDGQRIGIWGTSYSGGHALMVAAIDRRIKCVVASVPLISGSRNFLGRVRPDKFPALLEEFAADRVARQRGAAPRMIAVVSQDPSVPCAQTGQEAWENFQETLKVAPDRPKEVTLRTLDLLREYEPGDYISRIAPTPLLLIVTDKDYMAPTDTALEAFERALEPKKLLLIEGDHYVCYRKKFDLASTESAKWFVRHLMEKRDVITDN